MAQPDRCPDCGAERPANGPRKGVCPKCLFRLGLDDRSPALSDVDRAGVTIMHEPASKVLSSLEASFGAVPRIHLRDTDGAPEPPIHRPTSGYDLGSGSRYRIDGEIARGGMGAVLRGRDPDLGRDVALKVLRDDFRDNADMVRRFVEEAQIGGQLQHPGIVPIYEMGAFDDRRPYFAMKLVKGDTLAKRLQGRKNPADGLPHLLSIFEAIAQTVAYSHARGVIHRDLKPSNVMVGSFGEVQVMDWGLAKVLPRGGVADDATAGKIPHNETVIATARSGSNDSDLSHAGSVLGTPSYMAPEQARGEIDRIGERADVFALGSILCEILTGTPAFVGRSSGEILRTAALGDLADATARLNTCGVDADLIAIARDCLAREPEDRLRDAGDVAQRVTAYLAGVQDKLRRAELQSVEERARRRLTTVAAAAVILLGLAGGGGYVWNQQQKAERVAKTTRAVDDALADAARLRGEAQAAAPGNASRWAEAVSAAKRAEGLLAQGESDVPLRGRVTKFLTMLEGERAAAAEQARRIEADRKLLAELETVRVKRADQVDPKQTDAQYATVFRNAGLNLDAIEPAEAGKWLAARSAAGELTIYLDDWSYVRRQAERPEPDWRRLIAAASAADPDPWRGALRARTRVGRYDVASAAALRRLAGDEKVLDAQALPSLYLLARQIQDGLGDHALAARVLQRAVARDPGDFWARIELGITYYDPSGDGPSTDFLRPEEAIRHLTAAVAIRPRSPWAHDDLAFVLAALGKHDEAVAEYRAAIRLKPEFQRAHYNLGLELKDNEKTEEAAAEFREAIRLKTDDAYAHVGLALTLAKQKKLDEAAAECREAIRLKPNDTVTRTSIGIVLRDQGKLAEAVAECREAVRIKPDYYHAHYQLGLALKEQGKTDDAIAEYREAIRIKPDNPFMHNSLGFALRDRGNVDEAIAEYRTAIRLKPDYSYAHRNLGYALRARGNVNEAIDEYRQAIRLKPDDAYAHDNLGFSLRGQGKVDEAITEYREAIRLKPDYARAHHNLGTALKDKGKIDEAIVEYRESIRLQPDYPLAHTNLATALQGQGKLDESVAEHREAIRLKPDFDQAHTNLGIVLAEQGKADEAIVEYREALHFKPDNSDAMNNLADALANHPDLTRRDPAAAIKLVTKAIAKQPDMRSYHNTLGMAEFRAGHLDVAMKALSRSMELARGGDAYDWYFVAMIHAVQGRPKDASEWFNKAVTWTDKNAPKDGVLKRLRSEAAAQLGPSEVRAK